MALLPSWKAVAEACECQSLIHSLLLKQLAIGFRPVLLPASSTFLLKINQRCRLPEDWLNLHAARMQELRQLEKDLTAAAAAGKADAFCSFLLGLILADL